ncbi:MAG: hypothetical protein AAF725_15615, partial [Acidobacteriota bacterium]
FTLAMRGDKALDQLSKGDSALNALETGANATKFSIDIKPKFFAWITLILTAVLALLPFI